MSQEQQQKLLNESLKLVKEGKWDAAITAWSAIIDLPPSGKIKAEAYNNRGTAKDNNGDFRGAIADYDRALSINPNLAKAYNNRGNTNLKMGFYENAVIDLDRAIDIDKQDAFAYSNRGNARSKMGDYNSAIADYDRALEIAPEHKNTIHNRAVALAMQESQAGRKEIEAAYKAQLRAQEEKFERDLRAKQEKLVGTVDATQDIVEAFGYEDARDEYDKEFKDAKKQTARGVLALAAASALIFGGIAWYYFDASEPFGTLPLVAMGSLVLSPLIWYIRILSHDKRKYWALREDARANLALTLIIKSNPGLRTELSGRFFEHHSKRGSANLIINGNRADTNDNILVGVQDIAKEVANRLKPGDKGGDS